MANRITKVSKDSGAAEGAIIQRISAGMEHNGMRGVIFKSKKIYIQFWCGGGGDFVCLSTHCWF